MTGAPLELTRLAPVRRALHLGAFQFLLVAPTAVAVALAVVSAAAGVDQPSLNFGTVVTWVVWWGALLVSLVLVGRAWCLVCPLGAMGEWLSRLSLWWRSPRRAGLDRPWPRRLRSLGPATALFVVFVFLDNGYGMSNSPRMTAGLVAVLALAAAWTALVFERRAFCRYLCPLTALLGAGALLAPIELRGRTPARCAACADKDCYNGNARRYGCPMGEFPGAGMETNAGCILCAECVRACPHDNLVVRLRAPGRDLWAARHAHTDAAVAASVIVGVATIVPLVLLAFLPDLRRVLSRVLPAGTPPDDPPRLAAMALLFVAGLAAALVIVAGAAALARLAAGRGVGAGRVFRHAAPALLPIAFARLVADLLEHALRTGRALPGVVLAWWFDVPWNRAVPGRLATAPLLGQVPVYAVQAVLLLGALAWSLLALRRITAALPLSRDEAGAAFVPLAALALVLTLACLLTLGLGLA